MGDRKNNIQLRSEEIEDILGKVPGWVTRNGILMLLGVILLLLLGSIVFKVPDVRRARITVSSLQPPAEIEARAAGHIEALLVSDNEKVPPGKVLAVIENPADFKDIMGLKEELHLVELPTDTIPELELPVNGDADLGPVQAEYATFYKNYRDYREFIELSYHQRKIDLLLKQLDQYEIFSKNLDTRAEILYEDYELSRKQYMRDSVLFEQDVVAESVYEDSRAQMLAKRASWQAMLSLKAENDIKIAGLQEQVLEMELKQREQLAQLTTSLEESLNNVNAAIATWETQYLIISPIEGQVTFNEIWSENQNVKAGDKVMTIIPGESNTLIGKIRLPLMGAGEVEEEQPVNIRFDNFPHLKYGMVKGTVSNVSKVPQDNYYTVEVKLPEGLKTYYNIEIDFSQNMQGDAEIITDRMRLIQRIFNPVKSAVTRQREM
jgi:multidrug resistance efflux pump